MSNKLPKKRHPDKPATAPESHSGREVTAASLNHFAGPIPPPEMLSHYDQVIPGSAQIILQRAEYESKHRCDMEVAILREQAGADIRRAREVRRGQILGFLAVISVALLAAYALFLGQSTAAIGLGMSTIAGLVTAFIKGREK